MEQTYVIELIYTASKAVEVQAGSLDEAKRKALEEQKDEFRKAKALCKTLFVKHGQKMGRIA